MGLPRIKIRTQSGMKERGSSLIETLVALAILGTIAVCFLSAISSALMQSGKISGYCTAENLARNQVEDIRSMQYSINNSYPITVSEPPGYETVVNVTNISPVDYPDTIQTVVVKVFRSEVKLFEIETFKVNR